MNRDILSIKSSASIDLMAKAKFLKDSGIDIVSLAGGEPDFDTPRAIRDQAISEIEKGNTHYAVGNGILPLRQRIAEKLALDNGIYLDASEIVVTPGAKMAIYLAVRAVIQPGDEVLIPTPSWVSYTEIVRLASGIPVEVPLDVETSYCITESILDRYTTKNTRMLIICTPNNPTGRVLNEQEIREIISYSKKRNIVIISDEVYEKILYCRDFYSMASYSEISDKVITVNGFSKAYAMTGWRLGYVAAPKKYIDIISKLYAHTITGTSPFIQEAAMVAFDCEMDVQRMLVEYRNRKEYFVGELQKIKGISVIEPEGAFYAWCKFDIDGDIAMELLEQAKVVAVPGKAYGRNCEKYIRFSFANSMKDLQEAIKRIKIYMSTKKERVEIENI